MKPTCPTCTRVVPAEKVNMEELVAHCESCNELFPLHRALTALLLRRTGRTDELRVS